MFKIGDKVVSLNNGTETYTINYVDPTDGWIGFEGEEQETFQILYPSGEFMLVELYESPLRKAMSEEKN